MCPASRCLSLPFLPDSHSRGQAPSSFPPYHCALLNRIRLLLHRLPAARCALGTSRLALLLLFAACACALLSHPSHPPPARRALASPPVTAVGLRARAGAVLLFAGSAVPPRSAACPLSLLAFLARRNQRVQHPPLNLSRSVPKRACFSPFIDPALTRLQPGHSCTELSALFCYAQLLSAKQTPRVSPQTPGQTQLGPPKAKHPQPTTRAQHHGQRDH